MHSSAGRGGTGRRRVVDGMTLHGVGERRRSTGRTASGRCMRRSPSRASAADLLRDRYDVIDCSATPYLPLYSTGLAARLTGARLAPRGTSSGGALGRVPAGSPVVARVALALESAGRRLGGGSLPSRLHGARDGLQDGPRSGRAQRSNRPRSPRRRSRDRADIAYVGRLIDEKRVNLLLDAAARLRQRVPGLSYSIIGTGPESGSLQARSVSPGSGGSGRFHGHLEAGEAYGRIKVVELPGASLSARRVWHGRGGSAGGRDRARRRS